MPNRFILVWFFLISVFRVLPHPANITPLTVSTTFAAKHFSKSVALLCVFISMVITDGILAWVHNIPVWGSWTLFTYSGYALMLMLSDVLHRKLNMNLVAVLLLNTLGYWIWTNFGTFLLSGLYAHTSTGMIACYVAALPFLRNAVLGNLVWGIAIFKGYELANSWQEHCPG